MVMKLIEHVSHSVKLVGYLKILQDYVFNIVQEINLPIFILEDV